MICCRTMYQLHSISLSSQISNRAYKNEAFINSTICIPIQVTDWLVSCIATFQDMMNWTKPQIEAVKIYEVRLKVCFFSNIKVDKSITKQHGQKGTNWKSILIHVGTYYTYRWHYWVSFTRFLRSNTIDLYHRIGPCNKNMW